MNAGDGLSGDPRPPVMTGRPGRHTGRRLPRGGPEEEMVVGLLLAVGIAGLLAGSAMWERSVALEAQRSTVRVGRSWVAGTSVLVSSVALLVGLLSTLAAQRFDASAGAGLLTALAFVGLVVAAVVVAYRANAAALLITLIVVADLVVVCSAGVLLVRLVRGVLA